jgi:NADH-quinone oxidoreductase subunit J
MNLLIALPPILFALGVVLCKNTFHAALCLLLVILTTAILFIQLDALLLAALVIMVYAGAVATLFLFVVMLVTTSGAPADKPPPDRKNFLRLLPPVFATLLLATLLAALAQHANLPPARDNLPPPASLADHGRLLLTTYMLPLQLTGFLLLAAMLGVIRIAKKLPE